MAFQTFSSFLNTTLVVHETVDCFGRQCFSAVPAF